MLTVASYQKAYVVDIIEFDPDYTPAWDAEAPEASQFLRQSIQTGALNETGLYVVYANDEYPCIITKL